MSKDEVELQTVRNTVTRSGPVAGCIQVSTAAYSVGEMLSPVADIVKV